MDRLESILTLMRLPGVGPVRLRRALHALEVAGVPIEDAFSQAGQKLLVPFGAGSTSSGKGVADVADRLQQDHVEILVAPFSGLAVSEFARRHLPPVLFAKGQLSLMSAPSVGFCGSRAATDRGLAVAADIAEQISSRGINVVSGGAKGVDTTAHRAALDRGGTTTIVLAEGIFEYRVRAGLSEAADPARTLLVSEFFPDDRWLAGRAMQRNRTICALSSALVLIEARSKGGTFAAGKAALEMGLPLFTADYVSQHDGNEGNRILLDGGAQRLRQSRATGRANLDQLVAVVSSGGADSNRPDPQSGNGQQTLWGVADGD